MRPALDEVMPEAWQAAQALSSAIRDAASARGLSAQEIAGRGVTHQELSAAETRARQLAALRDLTGADELLVTTITHDHADRVRSYALLAIEWAATGE
jgi:hypothetical protein